MKTLVLMLGLAVGAYAQSADWQQGVWHEPQVRYLVADMTLGGNVKFYRDYANKEGDPDSREAIRLWDSGARMVNTNEFKRKWVTNQFGKDGRVMRIVQRGSERTIAGWEVFLSSDIGLEQHRIRLTLIALALGAKENSFEMNASVKEALRRWKDGVRPINTNSFRFFNNQVFYKDSTLADGAHVRLNSDTPYSEMNVRYFLTDMHLGGAREFYHRAAEAAHEKGCEEAVARFDAGVKILNLGGFERKRIDGQTLITRKGSNKRINGMEIQLSTD